MSEQSSPPDSRVQSAIINNSCRSWRALSCRGSTTSAKQATNSSTGRPQRCIARRDSSHAPLHRNARVHAPVLTQVSYAIALAIWVSDLYSAQRGHAEAWQICLAHQLRDCRYAIEAGDTIFAPRMKALLLRAVVLARRHRGLAESTRREYRRRLEHALDAVMALAPSNRHGQRLRRRYGTLREHLFTFLDHPEVTADNNGSERELRPTATYRKVTGGFRSTWGADLYAGVRSVIGTAARRGIGAFQAIRTTLQGQSVIAPG